MANDDMRKFSLAALIEQHARGESGTRADAPARPVDDAFWAHARLVLPKGGKESVHMRIDSDVLAWFRGQGKGHLTRMNDALRSFMEAHRTGED